MEEVPVAEVYSTTGGVGSEWLARFHVGACGVFSTPGVKQPHWRKYWWGGRAIALERRPSITPTTSHPSLTIRGLDHFFQKVVL